MRQGQVIAGDYCGGCLSGPFVSEWTCPGNEGKGAFAIRFPRGTPCRRGFVCPCAVLSCASWLCHHHLVSSTLLALVESCIDLANALLKALIQFAIHHPEGKGDGEIGLVPFKKGGGYAASQSVRENFGAFSIRVGKNDKKLFSTPATDDVVDPQA